MKTVNIVAFSALAVFVGLAALAATPAVLKTQVNVLPLAVTNNGSTNALAAPIAITNTETLTGSLQVATAIGKFFNVSPSVVTALHNSGHGYGEIVKAFALAKATGKSVDDIFAMRAEEHGWGEIIHTLAVSKWDTSLGRIMHAANAKHTSASGGAPGNSGEHRQNEGKGGGQDDDSDTEKGKGNGESEQGSPGNGKAK